MDQSKRSIPVAIISPGIGRREKLFVFPGASEQAIACVEFEIPGAAWTKEFLPVDVFLFQQSLVTDPGCQSAQVTQNLVHRQVQLLHNRL
jgi:hypothetical protein